MKIKVHAYNSVMLLVVSIGLFILGAVMFTNPNEVVVFATYVLGGLIVLSGVFQAVKNYLDVKRDNQTSSLGMVTGIVFIVIGLVIIFLSGAIEFLIRFIIGGWILFSGINRLINALTLPKKDTGFWVLLTLAFLLIGSGVYTVLSKNLVFQYLGVVLMVFAILEIFGYIFSRKEMPNEDFSREPIKEAVVTEVLEVESDSKKAKKTKKKNKPADESSKES